MDQDEQSSALGEPYTELVRRLDEALFSFTDGPPFTLQRLCEILLTARVVYPNLSKLALALEKNLLVTSTLTISTDPYPSTTIEKPDEPDKGSVEPLTHSSPLQNGLEPGVQDEDEEMADAEEIAVDNKSALLDAEKTAVDNTSKLADAEETAVENKCVIADVEETAVGTKSEMADVVEAAVDNKSEMADAEKTAVHSENEMADMEEISMGGKNEMADVEETAADNKNAEDKESPKETTDGTSDVTPIAQSIDSEPSVESSPSNEHLDSTG